MTLFAAFDRTRPRRLGAASPAPVPSRWQAAVTALAFMLASLFGLIHEATTTHVRCAQHGELIDSDPAVANPARTATPVSAATREAPDPAARVRDLPGVTLHGHEHCSLASATRESRLVPHPPALAAARIETARPALVAPRVETTPGAALYRTAPKTSPPA